MISVVVPIYNVEKYLERCVRSLESQSYDNLEIILVDDGSTDSSGKMCDRYAQENEKIVAFHKENGGLSDARNYGMERAKGEYIIFIDSDDYVEPDMMELLISTIGNGDMATCGVYNDYVSASIPQYTGEEQSFETDNVTAFKLILEGKLIPATICNKLIRTSIAKKQSFPKGRRYEDIFYTNELMQNVKTVRVNTRPLYHYVHRRGSITTTPFKAHDMDIIYGYEQTKRLIERYPAIKEAAEFRLFWAYFVVLDRILLLDSFRRVAQYKSIVSYLKKNTFKIITNKNFRTGRKIAAFALRLYVGLYRMLLIKNNERNTRLYE